MCIRDSPAAGLQSAGARGQLPRVRRGPPTVTRTPSELAGPPRNPCAGGRRPAPIGHRRPR
eukprot:1521041-Pyramimonas_sp.AAC.1